MNQDLIREVVREVLTEVIKNRPELKSPPKSTSKELSPVEKFSSRTLAQKNIAKWLGRDSDSVESIATSRSVEKIKEIAKQVAINPARLGVWRAGTRYLTKVALKFRADHAVAKDAVYAELPEGFAEKNGWVQLYTKAKNKDEYLLRPDFGRQLSDESLQTVLSKGTRGCDIQITVADGLSPWAAERNAKPMVDEMIRLFTQEGFTVGTVFCVKYSRIAIQDVIGEALGAKLSMIILGERPGLGGGDSLSNYMIYGPKVGAVNALKSMISNIHPSGHSPVDAAKLTVNMVKKMFEQKCSGIELKI